MKQKFVMKDYATIDANTYRSDFSWEALNIEGELLMDALYYLPLLKFQLDSLKGTAITSATLYMKPETEEYPFVVDITSIPQKWAGKDASLIYSDRNTTWLYDRWLTDMIMGAGNSLRFRKEVNYDQETGLISIIIPTELVYAMINGLSYGLGLIDYKSKAYWSDKREHLVKKFNADTTKGELPFIEVEYSTNSNLRQPDPVINLTAGALQNDWSFEHASVSLSWSIHPRSTEYRYFNIYASESLVPAAQMTKLDSYFIPVYVNSQADYSTVLEFLKPETEYYIAVTVANNGYESDPVYASIKTMKATDRVTPPCTSQDIPATDGKLQFEGFNLYIMDDISKTNPVNGNVYDFNPKAYNDNTVENLKNYSCYMFDGKQIKLIGAPGEKMAFQLLFENIQSTPLELTIEAPDKFGFGSEIVFNRIWYLNCENGWFSEAVVPMNEVGTISIPDKMNNIPGQRFQSVFAEVEIPAEAVPGSYTLTLKLSTGASAGTAGTVPVVIRVLDIKLAKADFEIELNGYSPAPRNMGAAEYGAPDFDLLEQAYYRTAYLHNCMVNIVPYTQHGRVYKGCAPKIDFINGLPWVTDWSEFDKHFEKYLDGSYLLKETGKKIPISHMYLPFHENWPMPIDEYYKVKVDTDKYPEMLNVQKLKSTEISNDFKAEYRIGIKNIFKEFIRHFDEKGWQHVQFQYFLNNKENFKEKDIEKGKMGGGVCWWLLDEPVFTDDWEALRFFGEILREAQAEMNSGYNIRFRIDVSRYDKCFDHLDHILDTTVLSSKAMDEMYSLASRRKRRFGEDYWVYGGLGPVNSGSMHLCLWVLDVFSKGAKGAESWENYGNDSNFETPSGTAGFYPGNRFGLKEPLVSIRVKALRKAVELINYIYTFKLTYGLNEAQLRHYLSHLIPLKGEAVMTHEEDAGHGKYQTTTYQTLERLKQHIIQKLLESKATL